MFLAGIFLAAFANSLAAPTPPNIPNSSIPNPVCVVAAALTSCKCEPRKFRSIYDIIWSCIGTILLCTYISIHHNIPDRNHSWMRATLMKVRTTLYALLAPEIVIMWAMRQRIMAAKIAEQNKRKNSSPGPLQKKKKEKEIDRLFEDRNWTKTHGFFVQMGGLMVETGHYYEVVEWDITLPDKMIPTISEAEIRDHGKGDFLAKAIIVLQTTWFVVQCIARHSQGLVITELELVTLAFAALNIITYILWWDKPLNVCHPIYFNLDGKRVDGPSDFVDAGRWKMEWFGGVAYSWSIGTPSTKPGIWSDFMEELANIHRSFDNVMLRPLWFSILGPFKLAFSPLLDMTARACSESLTSVDPFYAAALSMNDHLLAYVYSCVIGVIFGGIHLIGWNFTFTTPTELWLWRSSSLVMTVTPLFLVLWQLFWHLWLAARSSTSQAIFRFLCRLFKRSTFYVFSPLYITARIIILFLALFSLRDLPDSAYQNVSWSDIIPHF